MSDDVTRVSSDELDELESKTDWERVENFTDEEIKQAVEEDPDAVLLDEEWFSKAKFVVPSAAKRKITIRLDEDIIDYFKEEGEGYQSRINKVLRAYVLAQQMD